MLAGPGPARAQPAWPGWGRARPGPGQAGRSGLARPSPVWAGPAWIYEGQIFFLTRPGPARNKYELMLINFLFDPKGQIGAG